MLTQERFEEIVRIVTRDGAATVPELARLLETSESTIRRDLVQLDSLGKVRKVHGGATALREAEPVQERNMQEKYSRNIEDKRTIAAYAATLVRPNDFIFLDAGSTTEQLATYLTEKDAVYVTNGITLAQKLAQRGLTLEAYCQFTGSDEAKLRQDMRPDAEEAFRTQKAVEKIAELEGLTVSDEEMNAAFERICADNHMSAADLKPYLDNGFVTVVRQQMLRDKATDLVRQAAHITQ